MSNRCVVPGCPRPQRLDPYCGTHYQQQRRGLPFTAVQPIKPRPIPIGEPEDCWQWDGTIEALGYGVFSQDGFFFKAHRYSWETLVGPIPEGKVVDHLCFNRACVNPRHMRLVSQKQNSEHLSPNRKNNTSGFRNVSATRSGKWEVSIRHNRKGIYIGIFANLGEAVEAAEAARAKYFTSAD